MFVTHIDYEEILRKIHELKTSDKGLQNALLNLVTRLKNVESNLNITIDQQLEENEVELWDHFKRLQKERLSVLDLSHEWVPLKETLDNLNNDRLVSLMQNAMDELIDHVMVFTEILRAHIDILEIKNSRRLSFMALIVSIIISYLAFWEFFARDFVLNLEVKGWSPFINYFITAILLVPMLYALLRAWRYRQMK